VCRTAKEKNKNTKRTREHDDVATEEDRVKDFVLSSDDEDCNNQESDEDVSILVEVDSDEDFVDPDSEYKKQKKAKLKKRNKRQPLSNKTSSKMKKKVHPKKKGQALVMLYRTCQICWCDMLAVEDNILQAKRKFCFISLEKLKLFCLTISCWFDCSS
jgi:hypothetical protein